MDFQAITKLGIGAASEQKPDALFRLAPWEFGSFAPCDFDWEAFRVGGKLYMFGYCRAALAGNSAGFVQGQLGGF